MNTPRTQLGNNPLKVVVISDTRSNLAFQYVSNAVSMASAYESDTIAISTLSSTTTTKKRKNMINAWSVVGSARKPTGSSKPKMRSYRLKNVSAMVLKGL